MSSFLCKKLVVKKHNKLYLGLVTRDKALLEIRSESVGVLSSCQCSLRLESQTNADETEEAIGENGNVINQ